MTELSAVQIFDKMKTSDAAKTKIDVAVTENSVFHMNLTISEEMFDFAHNKTIVVTGADGQEQKIKIQAGKKTSWIPTLASRASVPRVWYWPHRGKIYRKLSLDASDLDVLVRVMAELKRQFIASQPASIGNSKRLKI